MLLDNGSCFREGNSDLVLYHQVNQLGPLLLPTIPVCTPGGPNRCVIYIQSRTHLSPAAGSPASSVLGQDVASSNFSILRTSRARPSPSILSIEVLGRTG